MSKESPNWDAYVNGYWANEIRQEAQDIERHHRCGCPQCLKRARFLQEQHQYEYENWTRPPAIDHEEQILIRYALRQVNDD